MKRIFTLLIAITLGVLLVSGCGSKNGDANEILNKQAAVTEAFVNDLEGADSADEVVGAINHYKDGMKELLPMIIAFNKKYPEYKNNGVVPTGMEKQVARMEAISVKMQSAMMKTMRYMFNPKVQKAMESMARELEKIEN